MSQTFNVPFLDLVTPHRDLEDSLVNVFRTTLNTAGFIGGPMVDDFEAAFGRFCKAKHCVGVSSGTDALRFALIGAGVQPGDCVVTVPNTFVATVEAISQAGATAAFVDIDERTYTLDPGRLGEFLERSCARDARSGRLVHLATGRTVKAVVPVHLYGQTADMDSILELAEHYGLITVEDACQAHGAEYYSRKLQRWQRAGALGTAAAFSFYPGKNLGACGEAGAVTTNDEQIAKKVRMLRDHGQSRKYCHEVEGYNGRLDSIQAGFLRVKLRYLAEWNNARRERAAYYNELFSAQEDECLAPFEPTGSRGVYHLYVVRVPDRDGLRDDLTRNRIGTGIHYPIPLHMQKAYQYLGYKERDFPVAEKVAREILSLPMFPHLRQEEQEYVARHVHDFLVRTDKTASIHSTVVSAA